MKNISDNLGTHIRRKALELKRLDQAVKASLPTDCHSHVNVAGIRGNELILLTDSPVWQTRLRMFSHAILEALQQHTNSGLSQIKFRLLPPQRIVEAEPAEPKILSQSSGDLIEQTANCVSDPALQSALLKLSKKARQ